MPLTNDSDPERFSLASYDEGVFSRDSSFDALFSNDDAEEAHAVTFMPHSS